MITSLVKTRRKLSPHLPVFLLHLKRKILYFWKCSPIRNCLPNINCARQTPDGTRPPWLEMWAQFLHSTGSMCLILKFVKRLEHVCGTDAGVCQRTAPMQGDWGSKTLKTEQKLLLRPQVWVPCSWGSSCRRWWGYPHNRRAAPTWPQQAQGPEPCVPWTWLLAMPPTNGTVNFGNWFIA